jgi:1,4-alpha-glucan branching enzyme
MHDTLDYMSKDSIYRKYDHNKLTFHMMYSFSENFLLPLSHDEVVYGKGSLLRKMPGDDWQKFANLRLLLGYMYAQPGKKLLFMGVELGQWSEWYHETSLSWHLLDEPPHAGLLHWVEELNRAYRHEPALHEIDDDWSGFEWIDANDADNSVISLLRKTQDERDTILVVCNFTPVERHNYRVGVPRDGFWRELLNSDANSYGGSHQGNMGGVDTTPIPSHGKFHSISITLPPLAALFFKCDD